MAGSREGEQQMTVPRGKILCVAGMVTGMVLILSNITMPGIALLLGGLFGLFFLYPGGT